MPGTNAHKLLAIALGLRKNRSAYQAVLKIAESDEEEFFRRHALRALGQVGSEKDIAFLEHLAANDPLSRPEGGPHASKKIIFPIREAATQAILELRRAQEQPSGK